MEYKSEKNINSLIEKKIEKEIEKIAESQLQIKDKIQKFYEETFENLNTNFINNLKKLGKEIETEFSYLSTLGEKNTSLEQAIKDLKKNLIEKNTEIIELETEKKNWNKVSYTKFLDKQLQEKKKDLDVMKLRFDHISKQNQILGEKLKEKTVNIKDIEINLGDDISLVDSNPEPSILDNNEENSEMNITMDIQDKTEYHVENNEETSEIETQIADTNINNEKNQENLNNKTLNNLGNEQDDNISNSSETTLSSSNDISQEYEVYKYQNKKGQTKKYLKKIEGKKIYLFKYTTNKEEISDAVGEIRIKNNIEKPSFYRKKT